MIINDQVIKYLSKQDGLYETGISSYWSRMFKDYEFNNGEFTGKTLPEGKGDHNGVIKGFFHYLLQTPFRLKGSQFSAFNNILNTTKLCHGNRNNNIRIGSLRQAISLSMIQEHLDINKLIHPIVIIGDGYGFMASLILSHFPNIQSKVIEINLNNNLLMDAIYIKKSVPTVNMALVRNKKEYNDALIEQDINCILIQADNANLLTHNGISLVINIASMQEMNPPIIEKYFNIFRKSRNAETYFYCLNRQEKILPDGTIVNFFNYPWHPKDNIIIDELCPWHQKYYRLLPPFYFNYDGQHQHRLILCHK
jgi:hypothetical protein